eukprot:TRINITY_DN838_c0_g1_i2.p1 TRINITY_DN838_c0_g1~~TRINITY_DN838_c0_g1_i2.p1  ORF type:complete len:914 (-),score=367.56 TRINITY_DN838_c0_g1_i2:21-2762(-)
MASEVIQHAERLKRLLNQDDGTLTNEVTNFLNKYAVPSATPLVQASSRAFNDTDLYELLLDKGRDILPAELFSRFMMFYATLDDTITIPLFNEFGGIAEILMTMDSKIDQPSVVAAGAQVLAVLAERDVNLRTEIGAGDGMGLLVEALEAHKDNPISSVALMAALTNMMYNHFENKGTFLQQNGLHILMEVLTRNSVADRAGVVTAALCLLRNLTNLDQVRSMEATKAVHLTRDLLPILNKFVNNERLIQHGAWSLLNLLHGSQQNKVILTDRGGLEFVSKCLSIWKTTSVRVVEPICLIVQQLAKLAINRTALVDKGVVALLVSVMENNRSSDGVVVLLPAAKSLYRLSFNAKNRKVIGASGAISHLLWPLNNALASPKLHRVIARALLKLCREDENKDVIRNEGGVGAIVTSMNYFRDNPSVTALMVRAMNCLFVKDGGASSSPVSAKPASQATASQQQRPSSSSDSDSDGESPEGSDSDTDSPRTPPDSASGLDDLEKIAANIMSPRSDESDETDGMDVNMLVETLIAPSADVAAGLKDDALAKPAITVVETDNHATREHKDPAMPAVVEGDDEDEEAKKERERLEAEQAIAAARAEAEADFAAEQARLKKEEEEAKRAADEKKAKEEMEALARREADALAQKQADEKKRQEEEAAAAAAAAKKKADEEAAAAAARKKREEEEAAAAAAKKKADEEAAAAAAKKKADEEAAAAAAKKKKAEEEAAAAAKKKADEEAAAAAAAAKKKAEEDAAAAAAAKKKRGQEEAAAAAAAKKKAEEEAARKAKEEADRAAAAAKKDAEEKAALEAKRREEEQKAADAAKAEAERKAAEAKKAEEAKRQKEEEDKKAKEEAELRKRRADAKAASSASKPTPTPTPTPAATSSVGMKTVVVAVGAAVLAVGTWFLTTWNK